MTTDAALAGADAAELTALLTAGLAALPAAPAEVDQR